MKKAIIAKKIGMTQVFSENGTMIPVTVLEAGPCMVVQKKTMEKDGYEALQVGFGDVKPKHVTKPLKGHFEANLGDKAEPRKLLRELRLDDISAFEVGTEIKADVFAAGDHVDVIGISKGKGFQGAIKRHGSHRGPMTHGSKYHRGLGSMGSGTTPGSVKKGKKMPGHMGAVRVTVQNLVIVRADAEKNLLLVRGAVPGVRGSVVMVKNTTRNK
ncbi:MAG: 50S ribosomal protein L3 [Clostridiales bacterium]|jgi:large subunit ribosomal protein L3|nr:50S ribosomal protein L3 [Clostridiales bacterium]